MKIDSVVVLCWAGDFRLARICLASVRHFYPDIPLYLMKDIGGGNFDTSEVEKCLRVSTTGLSDAYGPSVGKLELLFRPELGRFLFVDADQIFAGPVLDDLDKIDAQFVVVPDAVDRDSPDIERLYYDRLRLRAFDPSFQIPPFHFNAGQFVGTPGILNRDDFGELVEWGRPIAIRDPKTFKLHEQGLLNYSLHKAARAGRLTLTPYDFMHLARTEYFWTVPLAAIRARQSRPLLFHWAGTPRNFVSLMCRSDLLKFFENSYYRRVKHGTWLRLWRGLQTAPGNTYRCAYEFAGRSKRKANLWLKRRTEKARLTGNRSVNTSS